MHTDQLNRAYDFLMKNSGFRVQLSSHTDSRGSDRIVAKGYGETQLING